MAHPAVTSRIEHKNFLPPFYERDPQAPWWELLRPDFHEQPEAFTMPWRDRLAVSTTAALDRVANTLFSTLLSTTVLTVGYDQKNLLGWVGDSNIYLDAARSGDPTRLFREPPSDVLVKHSAARGLYFRPKDGVCEVLTFRSPYRCLDESYRERFESHKRNATARALYWRHNDGPRPTIIGVHGFNADPFALNQIFFALPWFYSLGCNVALFTMPFHGSRAPLTSGYSGRHFFAGGPSQIIESMGQTVCDLRVLVRHLHENLGVSQTAITGMSLGGLTASLMASVEPRLTCVIPNVPVVSLGDLLLEWHPIAEIIKYRVKKAGYDLVELRKAFAVISALSYRPVLPKENLMIIAGAADRMAPPKQSRLLCDHWGHCNIHWFPGNHTLHLDRGNYLREQARFLNRVGFLSDDRYHSAMAADRAQRKSG
jgi:pimeloyl-ACP methyl ester carboxylesterase